MTRDATQRLDARDASHAPLVRLFAPTVEGTLDGEASLFEPHVAIDLADPRRATVVAMYPTRRLIGTSIACWQTDDGGLTWSSSRVAQARFDGEGAADAVVAYHPDGALLVALMALPASPRDEYAPLRNEAEWPPSGWEAGVRAMRERGWGLETDVICLARSEDHGASWSSVMVRDWSAHMPKLAVDTSEHSPHFGNVYLASWDAVHNSYTVARSLDGGRTVGRPVPLGGPAGFSMGELVVDARGHVYALWALWDREAERRDPAGSTAVFHAHSEDGGATFRPPTVVAERASGNLMGLIDVAAEPSGELLAVWSEGDAPAETAGTNVRSTLRFRHSLDGRDWTESCPLPEQPLALSRGLPAVAATDAGWHVLAYESDATTTSVRLHSFSRDLVLSHTRELATRAIALQEIHLLGDWTLRHAADICHVGDYMGLAVAGDRLAAAIVLPETDDWRSPLRCYAVILSEDV